VTASGPAAAAPFGVGGQGTAGLTDVVSKLQAIVLQLSQGNTNISGDVVTQLTDLVTQATASVAQLTAMNVSFATLLLAFPRVFGTFTLSGVSSSTTIAQAAVKANSVILLTPTNSAAATLQGSTQTLYLSAISPGVSFTVHTADFSDPTGTETFQYACWNPT
jgi:hypothetical protein